MAAHNKKPLYNHLKHMSNPKDSTTTIIHNSMPVASDYEEAVLFYFNSTFTHSDFHEPMTASEPPDKLPSIEMSISDVSSVLNSLDPTKAMGCDKIGPKTLKFCSSALASPLTHLFTLCIKRHTIPEEWKHHTITPVFKSGDRSQVTNYRPISLLCSISKVLETIIYGKIIGFIRPKISQSQFGFLSNSSCLTQQLTALHNIFKSLDEKREVDTIYIDFSKAFDTVPHRELICKLKCFGIAGELLLWFQGYLTSRTHTVSRDGTTSNTLLVVSGVPQGSILDPLLFLIYVNDLPEHCRHPPCLCLLMTRKSPKRSAHHRITLHSSQMSLSYLTGVHSGNYAAITLNASTFISHHLYIKHTTYLFCWQSGHFVGQPTS